ncbi:hypothetical protein IVB18_47280 [Bradyrhizobium sp. 186]|uniref:hypothetical protein n=1 Tax=Bradyrhizobium sp. 186 TaxID=2782654 RepID=UPI0020014DE3|nr:hypothetical protein [Bradyrhizobium sp. 186]UPK35469.1 hypothetical protein IVB18_47280 [Bradyrhizobium sp. 186]
MVTSNRAETSSHGTRAQRVSPQAIVDGQTMVTTVGVGETVVASVNEVNDLPPFTRSQ